MGPFTNRPTGIWLIDTLEGVIALVLAVTALWSLCAWVFKQGKAAARKEILGNQSLSVGSQLPSELEHFLACDRCGKETEKLLQRDGEPQLCETCFTTNQPLAPRNNPTEKPTGASG